LSAPSWQRLILEIKVAFDLPKGGTSACCFLLDDSPGWEVAHATDHRNIRFDDASFFSRNLLEGVSEHVLVIKPNGGHRTESRGADIGAVEPAAQTYL
jgi:hypothetical protein